MPATACPGWSEQLEGTLIAWKSDINDAGGIIRGSQITNSHVR